MITWYVSGPRYFYNWSPKARVLSGLPLWNMCRDLSGIEWKENSQIPFGASENEVFKLTKKEIWFTICVSVPNTK